MWTNKKPVKKWKLDTNREKCNCSQYALLMVSGYSEKQGPTHYCPVCRWAFWPVMQKPTANQINLMKKDDPEACEANMKYIKMCNKPDQSYGKTSKNIMIEQFGRLIPYFLTDSLKEYWINLYCEKFPNCDMAKEREKIKKEKERRWSSK
jgi:hypothetical protein